MTGDEIEKMKRENARLKSLVDIADNLIPPKGSWHRKWTKAKRELGYAGKFDVVCFGGNRVIQVGARLVW